jgi:hypothetical protein
MVMEDRPATLGGGQVDARSLDVRRCGKKRAGPKSELRIGE